METILATIALMGILMLSMAVGVIFSGRRLKGSCGGVGGRDCLCEEQNDPQACILTPEQKAYQNQSRPVNDGVMVYE